MSDADFADLPNKVVPRTVRLQDPALESREALQWIFIGYCEKFLSKNAGLKPVFQQFAGKFDDPECRTHFTAGQWILHSLAALEGQVTNGGLAQFFWNCPDLVFEVSEPMETLGEHDLAQAYNRAVKSLAVNQNDWFKLRQQSTGNPDAFWRTFQESYDVLDLHWFDEAYFRNFGPALVARLVNYVRHNKAEFIGS
jgi:hypothetical protein